MAVPGWGGGAPYNQPGSNSLVARESIYNFAFMVTTGVAVFQVEFWDNQMKTLPIVLANNSTVSATQLSTADNLQQSLAWFINSLNINTPGRGVPVGAVGGCINIISISGGGVMKINNGGTDDETGVRGLVANLGPTQDSTTTLVAGDSYVFGRGN